MKKIETEYKCSCGFIYIFSSDGKHPKYIPCKKCKKKIYAPDEKSRIENIKYQNDKNFIMSED